MKQYLIYALKDPNTLEIRYIGKSCSGLKRPREHSCPLNLKRKKTYCTSWIKSLGKKPLITVLTYAKDPKQLVNLEKKWIRDGLNLGWKLTNHTLGGEGTSGFQHSREAKLKISKAFKGNKHPLWKGGLPKCLECNNKVKNYDSKRCRSCYSSAGNKNPAWKGGLPKCEICNKKLSGSKFKRCMPCKNIRPIMVYNKKGNFIESALSAKIYADKKGLNYNNIRMVLKGYRKTHKGLIFKYKDGGVS